MPIDSVFFCKWKNKNNGKMYICTGSNGRLHDLKEEAVPICVTDQDLEAHFEKLPDYGEQVKPIKYNYEERGIK